MIFETLQEIIWDDIIKGCISSLNATAKNMYIVNMYFQGDITLKFTVN